jgi:hypothetical protein
MRRASLSVVSESRYACLGRIDRGCKPRRSMMVARRRRQSDRRARRLETGWSTVKRMGDVSTAPAPLL